MTNQITTQTQQLSTFNFESNSIRVIAINNEPWFVVADVCRALNLSSPTKAVLNLDEDEVALSSIQGISKGNAQVNLVSESGMYTLILRCRDAVKKGSVPHRFRKWVTAEVLPQIRKTGQYLQNQQQIAPRVDPLKELISREMPVEHLLRFVSLWFRLYDCNKVMDHLKAPLEQLGSKHAAHVYSCAVEDKITLGILKRILEPMLNDIEVPEHERHYRRALEELRNYKPTGIGKLATI
ncbi:BRO family protein [Actinobacillus equuli subsp. equuli]|uniref:BRO family protein n=1 Tax=Actinobacillus equuli subsp. equuli TaxID=202947 RepID=A0A9X4G6L9_ACTEU|nr:BRO family protein [Actinobacillus equuli]MDE8035778.1 BRO family protein [Actinobacillus equuli subsp. equuli]